MLLGFLSFHGVEPQCLTSGMEVELSPLRAGRIGQVERVRIQNPPAARNAKTAIPLTLSLSFARITVGRRLRRLLRNAQADLRFDPSAIGA